MPNRSPSRNDSSSTNQQQPANSSSPKVVDAVRHVGPTLEAEGRFIPSGELPENRIENRAVAAPVDVEAIAPDRYDREAEAMGAEPLRTRLPGDTSSGPHTDVEGTRRKKAS